MIAGASIERLAVSASDLLRLSPQVGKPALEAAQALLSSLAPGKLTERRAILWGHDVQRRFADTVAAALALSQQPVMVRMQAHVSRLLDILEGFDLAAMAGSQTSGLGGVLKSFNRKTDTLVELESARTELAQLGQLMDSGLEPLLELREDLQANAATQQRMAVEVEGAALSALFLSEHFGTTDPGMAERFVERSMSLTQTLAQIRGDEGLRNLQVEGPLRTITAIQNVTLVSMPEFLASLSALTSLRPGKPVSPTEARELTYKLRNIVSQLAS